MSLHDNVVTYLDVTMSVLMFRHVMNWYVRVTITWLDCVSLLEHRMTYCMWC